MQKKTLPVSIFLIAIIFTIVITAVVTHFIDQKQTMDRDSVVKITRNDLDDVQDLYDLISTNYVDKVDKEQLIQGALKGMTESLEDPESEFLTAKETKELNAKVAGSFEGIGASLQLENRLPVIDRVPVKNSPAEKAKLKAEDIILEVDGQKTQDKSLDQVASMIRGKKGTQVKLLIQRGSEKFEVSIERDIVPEDTVKGELDSKNKSIGSIQIDNFRDTTALEFRTIVESLRKEGATSFVIDLRQNSGGLMAEAERVASYFLENGDTIAQFSNNKKVISTDKAGKKIDQGFKVKEPTVFLVDQESSYGAELLAAAVKSKNYPIIGVNTFGKGSVQNLSPIGKDNYVQLTIMRWFTPDGSSVEGKGVAPTIEADYPEYAKLPPISKQSNWRIGDSGTAVKNINTILKALGYSTEGDLFNDATKDAVVKIQMENNLSATGALDNKTIDVLQEELFKLVKTNDVAYAKAIETLTEQ
ncbi:S41 family peptidase [Enterococcus xiangfangensis]|uniref:S41 family peptidase n=1 Tax=Enterococcus xiangfangensis TaxID=1296537 RepID=A0ABU3F9N9_9ENTE|nr:S41 family peptidase [Enterococcus xiangfangensis]MBM7711414.1 carboxyl-terminal processing protease [Enterococcus xiangfangensis]MDT2759390.1 S41 family peptidase [Enterococcus xiangfangensis]NBK09309.1 PDZ domain-containing protein [Enterococcus asini]